MSNDVHLEADFTLNIPHLEADFTENTQPDIQADFNIKITPSKVSQLENDLNFQTEEQVQEAIQAESEIINNRIDDEVERLEQEIEQSTITIQGSPLIDVSTENQTATITSKTFVFEQGIASDTWIINHNLNKKPSITLTYTTGEEFKAHKEYNGLNQVIVRLDSAATGFAYLN